MAGPHDDELDVPSWLLRAARTVGLNEIRVRWKLMRWYRKWLWLRRELVPPSRRFAHQTCPECGAVQDERATTCSSCGGKLGSRLTKVLRGFGLSIPSALTVSSLLGLAMIAVYARMIAARPGQGILSWDVPTLIAFGANWFPAVRAGQIWRLATHVFLHIGLWHLGFNLVALSQIGPSVEEVFGRGRMVFLFAVTGIIAGLASGLLGSGAVSAGASGALMGLIGVAAGWGQRLGTTLGRDVRNQMLKWGAYTMVFGVFVHADHVAHAAGFIAGGLLGISFRPETLAYTKRSGSSLGMGFVGALVTVAAVLLALLPPTSSRALAARWSDDDIQYDAPSEPPLDVGGMPAFASDFERLPAVYGVGTSQRCGRGAFLAPRDERVGSSGDFLGRARAVFGAPDSGGDYVLRHRATGIVITIYSTGSGPAFGGGPVYRGELPPADEKALLVSAFEGAAVDPDAGDAAEDAAETLSLLEHGRLDALERELCRRARPDGFAAVAASLERLLDSVPPADWEGVEETDDGRYRVGAKDGKGFADKIGD